MSKSPIEKDFLQRVFDDILARTPGMATLPNNVKYSIELGFLYGAAILTGVMGELSRKNPEFSKAAQAMVRKESVAMLSRLRDRVIEENKAGGAMPDITGFPMDREFKL